MSGIEGERRTMKRPIVWNYGNKMYPRTISYLSECSSLWPYNGQKCIWYSYFHFGYQTEMLLTCRPATSIRRSAATNIIWSCHLDQQVLILSEIELENYTPQVCHHTVTPSGQRDREIGAHTRRVSRAKSSRKYHMLDSSKY